MKKVLILVVSSQKPPYDVMIKTALDTWDSFEVEGVETIYYCGAPKKDNTEKVIYFDIKEGYDSMGYKMLEAFEWSLKHKEFDYIARVNSSCYVDKKELIKHVQNLDKEIYGLVVPQSKNEPKWMWGGGQYLISKETVQKVVDNKCKFNHSLMEDIGLSRLMDVLGIEYTDGKASSIDKLENTWRFMPYGCGSPFSFSDFNDLKNTTHFFYRVKMDGQRHIDKYLMQELFKVLR